MTFVRDNLLEKPAGLFDPLTIKSVTFRNRIMMSPMCQYSSPTSGHPTDWHRVHYGSRATGGAGLVMLEATAVEPRGRISNADLGIWSDDHIDAHRNIVDFAHSQGAAVGIQLAHAGRKCVSPDDEPVAPSAIPFNDDMRTPKELSKADIETVIAAWAAAAARAREAGFDVIELHAAHGYLINQFLSPLTNQRDDEYGGNLEARCRFLLETVEAVQGEWPEDKPLFVRVSAVDYDTGGNGLAELTEVSRKLRKHGVDLIDVSSGGAVPVRPPSYRGYQSQFAAHIKEQAEIKVAAVGGISTPELAEEIIRNQRADLVALGRELLRHPYWPLDAARELGADVEWPEQYQRAKR